jgi:hypothetical protein
MEKLKIDCNNLVQLVEIFKGEIENFYGGNASAGTRSRKALSELGKMCKNLRSDIQSIKNRAKNETK